MSDILSIRIPKELKERLKKLNEVNWREEIVAFLMERVKHYERMKIIEEVRAIIEKMPGAEPGASARYVREDRDGN